MYLLSVKICHSYSSKTLLKGSVAMKSGKLILYVIMHFLQKRFEKRHVDPLYRKNPAPRTTVGQE